MLLSLVGVAGVVSNQWHCQLSENKHKLDTCLTGEYSSKLLFNLSVSVFYVHVRTSSYLKPLILHIVYRTCTGSTLKSHSVLFD